MIEEQSILLGYELFKWVNGCSRSALVAFVDMSFIALRLCAYSNTAAGHRGFMKLTPGIQETSLCAYGSVLEVGGYGRIRLHLPVKLPQ